VAPAGPTGPTHPFQTPEDVGVRLREAWRRAQRAADRAGDTSATLGHKHGAEGVPLV